MNTKNYMLALLAVLLIARTLLSFVVSPSFETSRLVDTLMIFASGMFTGVLLRSSFSRKTPAS